MSASAQRARPAGWPRHYRLRKKTEIVPVQRRGRRVRGRWFTLCVRKSDRGHLSAGLAVSKKVGNAVVRNRVKRRLREALRHLADRVGSLDVMVLANPSIVDASTSALVEEVERMLTSPPGPRRRGPPRTGRGGRRGTAGY